MSQNTSFCCLSFTPRTTISTCESPSNRFFSFWGYYRTWKKKRV